MHFMKSISFYQCCIYCVSILVDMSLFLLYEKEYKSTSLQSIDYLLVQKPLSYPFLFQSLYHKQHHALEAHHALQRDIFGRFLLAIFYCFNLKTHAIIFYFFLEKKNKSHLGCFKTYFLHKYSNNSNNNSKCPETRNRYLLWTNCMK